MIVIFSSWIYIHFVNVVSYLIILYIDKNIFVIREFGMDRVVMLEDFSFSRFGAGFWRLLKWNMSTKELLKFVRELIDAGVTTTDHADIYGGYGCEEEFGKIFKLEPSLRSKIEIVTKCGIKLPNEKRPENKFHCYDTSAEHIIKSAEKSLRNFGTDYLDVLLIHRLDYLMNAEETAYAFVKLKEEGKVRYFGVSNFYRVQFELLQSYLPFKLITNQIEFNLFNMTHLDNGDMDYLQMLKVSPMIWSPLAGGNIFNENSERARRVEYVLGELREELNADSDQIALAWILKHPVNPQIVLGSGKIERIKKQTKAASIRLSNEQWYRLWTASKGHDIP